MALVFRAEVNGQSIAYELVGRGPAMALLHGFAIDSRSWWPQLETLAQHFTLVAWDAPGSGGSSDPDGPFETGDWADCLAGLLDIVGVDRAHIVGVSWGGIVGQEFCRRYTDRTHSLVLVDTHAGWKGSLEGAAPEDRLELCLKISQSTPDEFVATLLPGMFTPDVDPGVRQKLADIAAGFHPAGFRLQSESSYHDRRALLPEISVPTLVVWGDQDARSPLHVAHQFHNAIPGAELVVIPNAGHLRNLEQSEAFDAAVVGFCSAVV